MDDFAHRIHRAHADCAAVQGRLRAGYREVAGLQLMNAGIPAPGYSAAAVTDPEVADLAAARAFFGDIPWAASAPADVELPFGRRVFRSRMMGVASEDFVFVGSSAVTFRLALPDDLDAIVRVDAEAFGSSEHTRAWLAPHLASGGRVETALALRDGSVVGHAYAVLGGDAVLLGGVGVVPDARRRGIGAALSSFLLERAFARGPSLAVLRPDTDDAARMYARLGFREVVGLDFWEVD